MTNADPVLGIALGYAQRGHPIFPIKGRAKEPLTDHGYHEATTDPDQIRAWWTRWPRANIGLACGHSADVLDVDGPEGRDSLAKLLAECGIDADIIDGWVTSSSGREDGGTHYWFKPGGPIRWKGFRPHLDWLGLRGYVIAPPSVHPSGRIYRWAAGQMPPELSDAPAWLHVAATRPVRKPRPPRDPDSEAVGDRPGDDFETRMPWRELLEADGWRYNSERGEESFWTRPGKTTGVSAAIGYQGHQGLYVFTSSAAPLQADEAYSKFAYWAWTRFSGDFADAARDLRTRGYGKQTWSNNGQRPRPSNEGPKPEAATAPGVPDLLDVLGAYQHLDDPWVVWFVLAVAISATLDGEPLWGMPIGPSSGGKTEAIRLLDDIAEHLGELTNAGLLTWTKGKTPHPTGALIRIGQRGLITISDFSTVLASSDRGGRDQLFANLRCVYDGELPRSVAGPYPLIWKGRATLLAGCTPAIDQYSSYTNQLGPRWVFYRLAEQDSTAARKRARRAQRAASDIAQHRARARKLTTDIVRAAVKRVGDMQLPDELQDHLVDIAYVVCLGRAGVPRHGYGKREIDGLATPESPPRLTLQLTLLARCLLALGLDLDRVQWMCEHAGLSSMPSIRLRVLQALATGEELTVSEVARRIEAHRHPTRFALEELQTIGIADRDEDDENTEDGTPTATKPWRLSGPDGALVADIVAGHPWHEKWEQTTQTHKYEGANQTTEPDGEDLSPHFVPGPDEPPPPSDADAPEETLWNE
jgi:Bifunctional DNA primase/polymerase, N-terminal